MGLMYKQNEAFKALSQSMVNLTLINNNLIQTLLEKGIIDECDINLKSPDQPEIQPKERQDTGNPS